MPYQAFICYTNDPEKDFLVGVAQRAGMCPYENNKTIFVDIFTEGSVWRAPGVSFGPLKEGTYVFRKDGNRVDIVKVL